MDAFIRELAEVWQKLIIVVPEMDILFYHCLNGFKG